jgi:hypothetical protein
VTEPQCPRCDRPIHDTAYVDGQCARNVRRDLERVADVVAGEAETTIARLDRITSGGGRPQQPEPEAKNANALHPTPFPVNVHAGVRHDAAVMELHTTARDIATTRGIPMPDLTPCRHLGCWAIRQRWIEGPVCARQHPLATLARWIGGQLDWLRYRPEANEALDGITDACATLERIVDSRPVRAVVGQCACGTYLYALQGAPTVRCQGCGTGYDVAASREGMRDDLEGRLLTAAECALLAAYLGLAGRRQLVRDLVRKWGDRGLIEERSLNGEPAYRFGEVMTRLAASKRSVA